MKYIFGLILLLTSLKAFSEPNVLEIPIYEVYNLKVEPNATVIYDVASPINVKKINVDTYEISVKQSLTKSSLVIIDSKGVRNLFIKGQNIDSGKAKNSQDKRLVKGYVRYADQMSRNLTSRNDVRNSNLIWYNRLWITTDYSFISNLEYRNVYDNKNWELFDYYLRFSKDYREGNQYYLHYGGFSELIDRPYGFLSSSYRGFIFGYNALSMVDFTLWTGNNKYDSTISGASGVNIDFNHLKFGYAQNDVKKIYNANTNFNIGDYLSTSTSVSTDGDTYIVSNEEYLFVPEKYRFLGLQYLNYSLGYVPTYSFGLYNTVMGERAEHKFQAQFANQDIPKKTDQSELELVPGVLSTMLSYNYSKFDLYQRDFYSLNTIYNTKYLFSGLWTSYEKSFLLMEPTDTLFFKPYLELFFSGEANKGLSIRNSHSFSYKKSGAITPQEVNIQNSTLGLYYSQVGYRYGVFAGSGQDNLSSLTNSAGSSSKLYGLDFTYRKRKLSYNTNYTHTLVDDTQYTSDSFKASVNYYNKRHQFGLTANYKRSQALTTNEDLVGSFAYTFNYDEGDSTLIEKIRNLRTSVVGKVCIDSNFNLKCDPNESVESLSNIEVNLSTDPQVETRKLDSDGSFKFSNLPNRSFFITLNNLPSNLKPYSSLSVDLSAGAGDYPIDIPLIESEEVKIRPILKGQYMPYIPVSMICENGSVFNKSEVLTDYIVILKPKNLKCEESFNFSNFDENIFIQGSHSEKGVNVYNLESAFKQIRGVVLFNEKPKKTVISINNEKVETLDNGQFIFNVDGKVPNFKFSKPGYECRTSPSNVNYHDINKFIFVNVRCTAF